MGRNAIETVLGAVVLIVAGVFLVFAYSSADLQKVQGYTVSAYFPKVDGLKEGTDVKMNGVKVGSISNLELVTKPGPNQYKVDVHMTLLPNIILPLDTIAMVASESLLGGKYMSLEVGVDEENIKTDGTGRITHTQSPMRLDDLIGQLIYGSKKSENGNGAQSKSGSSIGAASPPAVTASPAPAESFVPTPQPAPAIAPAPRPAPPVPSAPAKAAPAPAKIAPATSTGSLDGIISTLQPSKPVEEKQILVPPKPEQEPVRESQKTDSENAAAPSDINNLPPPNISVLPPVTLPAPHDPTATPPEPAKP